MCSFKFKLSQIEFARRKDQREDGNKKLKAGFRENEKLSNSGWEKQILEIYGQH